jgi:hypothetical protein
MGVVHEHKIISERCWNDGSLVALVVLAVGVLGYVMLQVRAIEATIEGTQRIQAINIARDLAERVRVNREGGSGQIRIWQSFLVLKHVLIQRQIVRLRIVLLLNWLILMWLSYQLMQFNMA